MYIGLHVQCRYSCQILMKLEFSKQIFEKILKYHIRDNSFTTSRVLCGRMNRQMTKLIVAFHNFANAPKIENKLVSMQHANNGKSRGTPSYKRVTKLFPL